MTPAHPNPAGYAWQPAPFDPMVSEPATHDPVVIMAPATRLYVTTAYISWQIGQSPFGPRQGVGLHELFAIRLVARLSWVHAGLWLVLAALVTLVATPSSALAVFVVCTLGGVGHLVLRRRYVLEVRVRDGRRCDVFLGAGYPPSLFTSETSSFIPPLLQTWSWLANELRCRGIVADTLY